MFVYLHCIQCKTDVRLTAGTSHDYDKHNGHNTVIFLLIILYNFPSIGFLLSSPILFSVLDLS